jgi:hypothetical protein
VGLSYLIKWSVADLLCHAGRLPLSPLSGVLLPHLLIVRAAVDDP